MFEAPLLKNLIRRRDDVDVVIEDPRLIGRINEARSNAERVAIGREARARLRFIRRQS